MINNNPTHLHPGKALYSDKVTISYYNHIHLMHSKLLRNSWDLTWPDGDGRFTITLIGSSLTERFAGVPIGLAGGLV